MQRITVNEVQVIYSTDRSAVHHGITGQIGSARMWAKLGILDAVLHTVNKVFYKLFDL